MTRQAALDGCTESEQVWVHCSKVNKLPYNGTTLDIWHYKYAKKITKKHQLLLEIFIYNRAELQYVHSNSAGSTYIGPAEFE